MTPTTSMLGHRITVRGVTPAHEDLPMIDEQYHDELSLILVEGEDLASGALVVLLDRDDHQMIWNASGDDSEAMMLYATAARLLVEALTVEAAAAETL